MADRVGCGSSCALALVNGLLAKKAKSGKLSRGEAGYLSVLVELVENYEKRNSPDEKLATAKCLRT